MPEEETEEEMDADISYDKSNYDGDYKDGKFHGKGTYKYIVSGRSYVYVGGWKDGKKDGKGKVYRGPHI